MNSTEPYVRWSPLFSISVPYIDRQHQQLLEIANDFFARMQAGPSAAAATDTLNRLIRYAERHFQDEEELWQAAQVPAADLEAHRQRHAQLVEEIFSLHQQLAAGQPTSRERVKSFLNAWIVRHILDEDKRLERYCAELVNFRPGRFT